MTRLAAALFAVACASAQVRYVGKTTYLNHASAVVTHTFDDSTKFVIPCLDALDKFGVKATAFVSTRREPITQLWPRLRQAVGNGHEIGSHSRTHPCRWPDTAEACRELITTDEVEGSRDDILANTSQPYVWSWCYPCGNCADQEFAQGIVARGGYLVGRNYPGEPEDRHNLPDLATWADNPFNAAYTQVVQKRGGIAKTGRTDVAELNAKFDEVYRRGGIYHFLSHPAWLDFGADSFYERHLTHVARRADVWYAPLGPLYAYRALRDRSEVRALGPNRFVVGNPLDQKIYSGSVTLEFETPATFEVFAAGQPLAERPTGLTDRWNAEYYRREGDRVFVTIRPHTTLEFRPAKVSTPSRR